MPPAPTRWTTARVHQAMRWGARALDFVEAQAHQRFGGLTGLRFNIGRIEGGIKANVIAPSRRGALRLPAAAVDVDPMRCTSVSARCADAGALERYEETFRGPSLPAGDVAQAEERRLAARDLADALGLPIGNAVDFWTEASLFSAAGLHRVRLRPGRHRPGAHRRRMGGARSSCSSYAEPPTIRIMTA